jgi:putative ABC transport system ATP-binding protein
MLNVGSVAHTYGGVRVLAVADFVLAADEHCALTGPSGVGKSTLLHILAGILPPTAGQVGLDGHELYPADGRGDRWRARRIGLVPQNLHLIASLTALENVALASYLAVNVGSTAPARAVLESLGLAVRLDARPEQLSIGERQRVAIARAIVNRPRLLLADEPTSSLDDENAQLAVDLLFDAARRSSASLIVATHDARIRDRFPRHVVLERPA